jgi:hypothetical protein
VQSLLERGPVAEPPGWCREDTVGTARVRRGIEELLVAGDAELFPPRRAELPIILICQSPKLLSPVFLLVLWASGFPPLSARAIAMAVTASSLSAENPALRASL